MTSHFPAAPSDLSDLLRQRVCQLSVPLHRQVHEINVIDRRRDHGIRIHKMTSHQFRDLCVLLRKLLRLLRTAAPHRLTDIRSDIPPVDVLWRHDQDICGPAAPAVCRRDRPGDQPLESQRDTRSRGSEALLGVIRPEHDHQQINRLMAHQARIYVLQTAEPFMDRIRKAGRASAQPLLDHKVFIAQLFLQQTAPALCFLISYLPSTALIKRCAISSGLVIAPPTTTA